ncbi:hypothetical protein CCACVL1_23351 [Corchorus capsularis]|uniref:Uncharacterized protein n=1 Tax=Corchorus capsularis TaxID=210143 RepID=A0A1R3GUB6_COCAP|nr:hypothetical protein CCACVL1_23351 [Corchorus capsularis]
MALSHCFRVGVGKENASLTLGLTEVS